MAKDINIIDVVKQKTVKDFLAQFKIDPAFTSKLFLDLEIGTGITNLDRIKGLYTKEELDAINNQNPDGIIIKAGTQVGLKNSIIQREVAASQIQPDTFKLTDFNPFISDQLKKLLQDPGYYNSIKDINGQQLARVENNDVTVYMWVRSLTSPDDNSQSGAWINVSAFVDTLQTVVTDGVGSFTITLNPVSARYDQFGWHLDNVIGYDGGSTRNDVLSTMNISKYQNKGDNFLKREGLFFNNALQENDLVYIRFERLAMEPQRKLSDPSTLWNSDVPGNIYDMIGLIDSVSTNTSERNINTLVRGRDLMKLLIEDGSYFFPEQIGQQIFTDKNSILTQRNLLEVVSSNFLNLYSFKSIATSLKFVFNKFSNIGIVANSALSGYGDRAIKQKYQIKTFSKEDASITQEVNDVFLSQERQGLWRITDMVFDSKAALRFMADNSISVDNGSIINSIRKFCQEPFVEFRGDTYGDRYYFTVRKPPFDKKGCRQMVYGMADSEKFGDGVNLNTTAILSLFTKGQLINDPVSKPAPSFSEFKKEIQRKKDERNKLRGRPSILGDLVIDIDESDVLRDNLDYSDEIYSWYRVIPRGLGVQNDISSFQLAPIIPLDEYALVWGNKSYSIEYNYSPIEFIDDSVTDKKAKYIENQAFLDLQFVIQSHALLPFTREGSITINGNRTIKRGMYIYYKPTDEVFYVNSVSNLRTVNDRITTLGVTRGMKEKYIRGVEIKFPSGKKTVSYYDIVNTDIDTNASIESQNFLKNWKVDSDIFNFFLQRRQWVE